MAAAVVVGLGLAAPAGAAVEAAGAFAPRSDLLAPAQLGPGFDFVMKPVAKGQVGFGVQCLQLSFGDRGTQTDEALGEGRGAQTTEVAETVALVAAADNPALDFAIHERVPAVAPSGLGKTFSFLPHPAGVQGAFRCLAPPGAERSGKPGVIIDDVFRIGRTFVKVETRAPNMRAAAAVAGHADAQALRDLRR